MKLLHFVLLFFVPFLLPAQHEASGTDNPAKQAHVKTVTVRSRMVHHRRTDTLDIERIIISSFKVYHYDTNGLPVKSVITDGGRIFTTQYYYDADGKLLVDSTFSGDDDSSLTITRYEYDAQARLSRMTEIDRNEKWKQRVLRSSPDSKFRPDTLVTLYSYPSETEMIIRVFSRTDSSVSHYVTKKSGREEWMMKKGRPSWRFKSEYNDSYRLVKEKTYIGRRRYSWRSYQYNEKGLVVLIQTWDRKTRKEAHIETYFEYDYY